MHVQLVFLLVAAATAAPTLNGSLDDKLKALQDQLSAIQKEIAPVIHQKEKEEAQKTIFPEWQPQKRMVAWQPMKRNLDERQPLLHVIEARLSEVLKAGEHLGISAEEVLQDLRMRNQIN